jgi:hypothetical protein
MELSEELGRIAAEAARFAAPDEELAGVLAAEPAPGERIYLCAYARGGENGVAWLALGPDGRPVESRGSVREATSIAAMCELAEESAGGGDLGELRTQLVTLRLTENPPGIDEAEEAALALEHAVAAPPRVASPEYLDAVGAATRRLERVLGANGTSPFAEAMKHGVAAVEALTAEVEAGYKGVLR